jgi:hypothetical protein
LVKVAVICLNILRRRLSKQKQAALIVAAVDSNGRTIWIADAHRDDGKRFVVRADEKLTAFSRSIFRQKVSGTQQPRATRFD